MVQTIQEQRDRYVAFAFAAAEVLMEVDKEGRILFATGSCESVTSLSSPELEGRLLSEFLSASDQELFDTILEKLNSTPRLGPYSLNFQQCSSPVQLRAINALGNSRRSIALNRVKSLKLEPKGEMDPGTGLLTTESFVDIATKLANSASNNQEVSILKLTGVDMENGGDNAAELQKKLGVALRLLTSDDNMAGQLDDWVFGVIHNKEDGDKLQNQFSASVDKLIPGASIEGKTMELQDSQLTGKEAAQALSHALRVFAGKVDSNKPIENLNEALMEHIKFTSNRMSKFMTIIHNLNFDIHFQPIVDLRTLEICHYEALTRFRNGQNTFEMIRFAEETGIIQEFDLAVVKKVLKVLSQSNKPVQRIPSVAVNLSARSLESDNFIGDMRNTMNATVTLAKKLMFEITESAEIKNLERMGKVVDRIRQRGNSVCLDDFGAGASAFHYIRALNVDYVKLDGAYVKNVLTSQKDQSILKSMTKLCKELKVKSVAESIETSQQATVMCNMGVDLGQGYLFAKPRAAFLEDGVICPV